jgi:hypothetical protein
LPDNVLGAIELARAVSDETLSQEILESTRELLRQLARSTKVSGRP